ncbi:thioredoxin domain-containing protein [Sinorhizobium psoraleae]|uniref:Thioredoxin domain-containing protein n=1 Tax=Sinorhizobium psoraleae TaxID=520838 RepID=A0ABT4K9G9_9HYPH|nr:thioredoxin domain-containing protein [Sinorhizobium psoraleae]MCZ4088609.1 thioredoxin domain-containing protein [Sinorhizobium psoraleae]
MFDFPVRLGRRIVAKVCIVLVLLPVASVAADLLQPVGRADRPLGSAIAPVTVIEYSSPTCPHCVTYRRNTAPKLEAEFAPSGKVRFLFRPLARNNVDLVIFMLADAQAGSRTQLVLDTFYSRHDEVANSTNLEQTLREIAGTVGIDRDEFDAAIADQSVLEGLRKLGEQARDDFRWKARRLFSSMGKRSRALRAWRRCVARSPAL